MNASIQKLNSNNFLGNMHNFCPANINIKIYSIKLIIQGTPSILKAFLYTPKIYSLALQFTSRYRLRSRREGVDLMLLHTLNTIL